jgi:hypothetical protein
MEQDYVARFNNAKKLLVHLCCFEVLTDDNEQTKSFTSDVCRLWSSFTELLWLSVDVGSQSVGEHTNTVLSTVLKTGHISCAVQAQKRPNAHTDGCNNDVSPRGWFSVRQLQPRSFDRNSFILRGHSVYGAYQYGWSPHTSCPACRIISGGRASGISQVTTALCTTVRTSCTLNSVCGLPNAAYWGLYQLQLHIKAITYLHSHVVKTVLTRQCIIDVQSKTPILHLLLLYAT